MEARHHGRLADRLTVGRNLTSSSRIASIEERLLDQIADYRLRGRLTDYWK
jgi:hypothetical protein